MSATKTDPKSAAEKATHLAAKYREIGNGAIVAALMALKRKPAKAAR